MKCLMPVPYELKTLLKLGDMLWMKCKAVFLLQPAWLPPLPSVDVTANLPGYIILSGYQLIIIRGKVKVDYIK